MSERVVKPGTTEAWQILVVGTGSASDSLAFREGCLQFAYAVHHPVWHASFLDVFAELFELFDLSNPTFFECFVTKY